MKKENEAEMRNSYKMKEEMRGNEKKKILIVV